MFAQFHDPVNDCLGYYGDGEPCTPPAKYAVFYAVSKASEPVPFYFTDEKRAKRQAEYYRTHDRPAVCYVARYEYLACRWQVWNDRLEVWE